MGKSKIVLGIVGVIALIGVLMYFNSNGFAEKQVERAAQKQAVSWCSEKYGIDVVAVSTKVHYNNPVKGGFYFFTPNPDYGPTKNATVTVLYQGREFHVYCDTRLRDSKDDYQKDEIMAALREYLEEDLGLVHLARLSCSYGRRGDNNYEIDDLFTGDVEEFLKKYSLTSAVLECVQDDFFHLTAKKVMGEGSYFQRYAVFLSYRSADMVGAVSPSVYPIYDNFLDDGEYLDSYCILSNISGYFETEHYLFDVDGSDLEEIETETILAEWPEGLSDAVLADILRYEADEIAENERFQAPPDDFVFPKARDPQCKYSTVMGNYNVSLISDDGNWEMILSANNFEFLDAEGNLTGGDFVVTDVSFWGIER